MKRKTVYFKVKQIKGGGNPADWWICWKRSRNDVLKVFKIVETKQQAEQAIQDFVIRNHHSWITHYKGKVLN